MTRVTHKTIQESTLANLQGNLSAMARIQEQLSTGKRINRPSDDPTGTVSSLRVRSELRLNDQYTRNADDATGWLNTTDTALQTTSEQLRGARTLVVQALNTGANSGQAQDAIATQLAGIRDSLLSLANTQYLGRNVFAGTSGDGAAVAPGPASVTGPYYDDLRPPGAQQWPVTPYAFASTGAATSPGTVVRQVDSGSPVRVDTDGRQVFGSDSGTDQSVFALLDQITVAVRSPKTTSADLTDLLGKLDVRASKVQTALSDLGARENRVQQAQDSAGDAKVSLTNQLSDTEDIDLPSTIVQMQSQQVAYQAALGATAKVLQPSLMDFLK